MKETRFLFNKKQFPFVQNPVNENFLVTQLQCTLQVGGAFGKCSII